MPKSSKKTVMSEGFKNAVKQRQGDVFRQQANDIVKENQRKQELEKVKKNRIMTKKQMKIKAKKAEISNYEKKLERAEKNLKDGTYSIIDIGARIIAILIATVGLILHSNISIFIIALVFLFISISFQAAYLDAESKVREYQIKLSILKQELENLLSKPPL